MIRVAEIFLRLSTTESTELVAFCIRFYNYCERPQIILTFFSIISSYGAYQIQKAKKPILISFILFQVERHENSETFTALKSNASLQNKLIHSATRIALLSKYYKGKKGFLPWNS